TALPAGLAMREGVKTAALTILVYLIALPFVFVAGAGFIAFFIATAWLLGREYFQLAAMRFRPPAEARAMRKQNAAVVFTAGLVIAAFVSIPIVNLATPLFGMAFMVHMHKRLSGPRPELIEPARKTSAPAA
ncbi:MAG: CysZ protein, partial [Bradyrhizobium sp.]|nr:CysZ protein [Bradyrhizobium sp.]